MEFSAIFTEMGWLPAILLSLGMMFVIIEAFVPGFGFFGIIGTISTITGIVVRIVNGLNVTQSLTLILLVFAFYIVASIFMVFSAKYGILGTTGLFENTLKKDYDKPEKELRKLVGKSGKTVGVLNLGGKAKINGKIYEVMSIHSFIESGAHIKVVGIQNHTIMVRKWFE